MVAQVQSAFESIEGVPKYVLRGGFGCRDEFESLVQKVDLSWGKSVFAKVNN